MTHPDSHHSDLKSRRDASMGQAYRLFYDQPLELVRGEGCWLFDSQGHAFLDAYNNVPIVGHCHPKVVAAVSKQLGVLNTHTRYLSEMVIRCSETLLGLFPRSLDRITFACSGTEAVELALRVARAHTQARGVIVTRFAYHGNSTEIAQISPEEHPPEGIGEYIEMVPAPDTFRSAKDTAKAPLDYHLDALRNAIDRLAARNIRPAALVMDTIFSSEGLIEPPTGYLCAATEIIHSAGGLLIADEVQAGFGRLGSSFWGFERHGVEPDMVTIGKPMGNGYPVSAMITRSDILGSFAEKASYFNTFGGSHAACAAVMAVLEVIAGESLQDNARTTGAQLRTGLLELAESTHAIGEVRGSGLYLGVDLVTDRALKTPDAALARKLVNGMRDRGVLIGRTGQGANVLKLRPPLVFSKSDAAHLLDALSDCLEQSA